VQFMAYEPLKNYTRVQMEKRGMIVRTNNQGEMFLGNTGTVLLAIASKMVAGSATYPYQVIRSRLQTYDAEKIYGSAANVVRKVWKEEGVQGFYKGLGPNLVRILPSTCVTFLVYENTKYYLPKYIG